MAMPVGEEDKFMKNHNICSSSIASSGSDDLMSRVDIAEVTDFSDYRNLSTSAVLSTCKHKILRPYLRLVAVIGLRRLGSDRPNVSRTVTIFSHFYLIQVILLNVVGYVLQFLVCFRRDRGFFCKVNESEILENMGFGVVLPGILHFFGFGYVLYLFRFKETEQLENLMERTFLLSAHRTNGRKTHLAKRLWVCIITSVLWVLTSFCSVILFTSELDDYSSLWLHTDRYRILFKVIFALSAVWQDVIQAIIITSYCLQVQLLSSSLCFLREKLLEHTIQPLAWIREINECRNVLNYLNRDFSPGVCAFIFLDASWTFSGFVWILRDDHLKKKISLFISVGQWLVATLMPFVLSASLSSTCSTLRELGHEVRIRPFVYQDTPGEDLDTILLYTSTLRMKSKLFAVPVSAPYLYACFAIIATAMFIAGQSCLL